MADVQTSAHTDESAVRGLAARAEQVDQVAPLDEATLLALRDGTDALHLTVRDGDRLVGYAQVRPDGAGRVAELVVDPEHRRRGIGTRLLRAAQTPADGRAEDARVTETTEDRRGPLEVWAHGDLPAARARLAAVGARPVRALWLLGRDLADRPAPVPVPPGVRLRPFRVGQDEAAWLAVNARAFATHPEQGRTTLADLLVRQREPWFDPDGLILAVADAGTLLGSVWTKIAPPPPRDEVPGQGRTYCFVPGPELRPSAPVGEIYVLGVDPCAQGTGLGRVLTGAGLDYLAGRGLGRVVLFVESDNDVALATYMAAGFVREAVHTRYRLPAG
ncbi:MAG: mycothiol synthase [Micrococcales bacterium]|nr:mycothiol synthase [Micrococcales bacterium]